MIELMSNRGVSRRMKGPRRDPAGMPASAGPSPAIALRMADGSDDRVLESLAELDEAPALEAPVLLAVIDGEAVAALSLSDGGVVANPFVRTEHAVALLRLRAGYVSAPAARRVRWAFLRPRMA